MVSNHIHGGEGCSTFRIEEVYIFITRAYFRLIEAISGKPEVETSGDRVDKTEAMQRLNLED